MAYVYYNAGSPTGSGSWATTANWFNCPFGCTGRAATGVLPGVTDCVVLESNICTLGGATRTVASICNSTIEGNSYCGGKTITVDRILCLNGGVPSCLTNGSVINLTPCCISMTVGTTSLTVENGTISGTSRIVTGGGSVIVCDTTTSNASICNTGGGVVEFYNSANNGTIICNSPSNSNARILFENSTNRGTICNLAGNETIFSNSINCCIINAGTTLTPGYVIFGCTSNDCSINYTAGTRGSYFFCGCSMHCGSGGTCTCYFFDDDSINYGNMPSTRDLCFFNRSVNCGCLCSVTCGWLDGDMKNYGSINACKIFIAGNTENMGCLAAGSCMIFDYTSVNCCNICANCFIVFCFCTANNGCITYSPTTCFLDFSLNTGNILGNVIFGSDCENTGTICGCATFQAGCNSGCITQCGCFSSTLNNTVNFGTIGGDASFGSTSYSGVNCGTVMGSGTFNCSAINEGCVMGNTTFTGDGAYNIGSIGTGANTACFRSCSYNFCGVICGDGNFDCTSVFCYGLITGNGIFCGSSTTFMVPDNFAWGDYGMGCICGNMCFPNLSPGGLGELTINSAIPYFNVNVGGCFINCSGITYSSICFNGSRTLPNTNTWVCGCYVGKFSNYFLKTGDVNFATLQGNCTMPLNCVSFCSETPLGGGQTANCGTIICDNLGTSTYVQFVGSNPDAVNYGDIISNTYFSCCTVNLGTICGDAYFYSRGPTNSNTCSWRGRIAAVNFSSNISGNAYYYACDITDTITSNGFLGDVNLSNTGGCLIGFSGNITCVAFCGSDTYIGHNPNICCIVFAENSKNDTDINNSTTKVLFSGNGSLNCGIVYCACVGEAATNINFYNQGCYLCDLSIVCSTPFIPNPGEAVFCSSNVFGARIDGDLIDCRRCVVQRFTFNDNSSNCGKIPANTYFNNTASNAGIISKSAMFKDTSSNTGTVAVTGVFCNCTNNRGTVCNAIFNNYAYNGCDGIYTNLIAYNSLQKGLNGAPILGGLPSKTITLD